MKWFKHETNDRDQVESKLIKKAFGAEGYGIYQMLLEVIGGNVEAENYKNWGFVSSLHTIETLAEECYVSTDRLKEFLKFCDEKGIFAKKNGKLFCSLILKRLDNYAEKVQRESEVSTKLVRSKLSLIEDSNKRREKKRVYTDRVSLKEAFLKNPIFQTYKQKFPDRDYELCFEEMCDWYETNKGRLPQSVSAFGNWLTRSKPDEAVIAKRRSDADAAATQKLKDDIANSKPASPETLKKIQDMKDKFLNKK